MTLLKVAEADVRESKLLDVEYEGIRAGTAKGGKGPSATERQRISHHREIEAAKKLGEEMFTDSRIIDEESSHRPPLVTRKLNKKQRYVEAKNSPILLKRLKDFGEYMWSGSKTKRQDCKNKIAGHIIPKFPAESPKNTS